MLIIFQVDLSSTFETSLVYKTINIKNSNIKLILIFNIKQ